MARQLEARAAGLGGEAVEARVGSRVRDERGPAERLGHALEVHDALLALPEGAPRARERAASTSRRPPRRPGERDTSPRPSAPRRRRRPARRRRRCPVANWTPCLSASAAQRGHAVRGAEKARLLLEERALAAAELRELPAQVVRVEPADLRAAPAGIGFERVEMGVGWAVAHVQVSDGDVELLARLGLDPPPARHGLEGEAAVVRVEVRGPNLPRGAVRGRDRIRHRRADRRPASAAAAAPPRAPCRGRRRRRRPR